MRIMVMEKKLTRVQGILFYISVTHAYVTESRTKTHKYSLTGDFHKQWDFSATAHWHSLIQPSMFNSIINSSRRKLCWVKPWLKLQNGLLFIKLLKTVITEARRDEGAKKWSVSQSYTQVFPSLHHVKKDAIMLTIKLQRLFHRHDITSLFLFWTRVYNDWHLGCMLTVQNTFLQHRKTLCKIHIL